MRIVKWALSAAAAVLFPLSGQAQTLKAVMNSDVKIIDPMWTTSYIVRNHGYMVYDTLFPIDEKFVVKPQMVGKWEVSKDGLTYTFTLRDGLKFHDGQPVRPADLPGEPFGERRARAVHCESLRSRSRSIPE